MRSSFSFRTGLAVTIAIGICALPTPAAAQDTGFEAHASVEQVYVTGATPDETVILRNAASRVVARGQVDPQGAFLFREVKPGPGYRVEQGTVSSSPLRVLTPREHPGAAFYEQRELAPGFGYLTTRDGTLLAIDITLPGPPEAGPYPTVVEYSGYDPANPESGEPATLLAQQLGYATVGVNMRGTGCSGGSWQYFEPLQSLDGYDAIEAIAAQPWVLHGEVGMVGISFSGITQLFVAATQPPHLAAITPLSVIDDTYRGVLYPGGILNTGFAVPWGEDRADDASPATTDDGGQGWARRRIESGDETCRANQALRLQTPDVLGEIESNRFYAPERLDAVTPDLFADRIETPTFIAGAWQDEQTGGRWPEMLRHFAPDTFVRATVTNGTHAEGLLPSIVTRWAEFLDFFVARRVPNIPDAVRAAAPIGYAATVGVALELPPDRFDGETDFDAALARYRSEPPVRVLFDNGAGGEVPGAPVPAFEASFDRWPVPGVTATTWYLADDGALETRIPRREAVDGYTYDPATLPTTNHPSDEDDFFATEPAYEWEPLADGTALEYLTEPLARDTVMLGTGSVDVWLRSSAADVDLEVLISEVRPDGQETYVQSGWLRASHRKLDRDASTDLQPVHTHTRADSAPLPEGRVTLVRVPVFPFGHAFREGSQVRVVIQAPGGNRPRWAFDALPAEGSVVNEVSLGGRTPSRVVLPVVGGIEVTTPLPPCPALRGQPCRTYAPVEPAS